MHLQEHSGCCGGGGFPKEHPTTSRCSQGWVGDSEEPLSALGELGTSGSSASDTGLVFQAFPVVIQLGNNSGGSWRGVTWR